MNPKSKSKNFTAAGPQAESPVIPGLTCKEAWDQLITTRQSISKEEVLQRLREAATKKRSRRFSTCARAGPARRFGYAYLYKKPPNAAFFMPLLHQRPAPNPSGVPDAHFPGEPNLLASPRHQHRADAAAALHLLVFEELALGGGDISRVEAHGGPGIVQARLTELVAQGGGEQLVGQLVAWQEVVGRLASLYFVFNENWASHAEGLLASVEFRRLLHPYVLHAQAQADFRGP